MLVRVSHDYVEMVADMKYDIPLRDKEGNAKVELILSLLGFTRNELGVEYEILNPTTGVVVRNPKKPYEVMNMIVYVGDLRKDFPHKNIYLNTDILVGNFTHGTNKRLITDVEELNDKNENAYNRAKFDPVEYVDRHAELHSENAEAYY